MTEKMAAADGIRRFLKDLRVLEGVLDEAGKLDHAAGEAQARLDRLRREEEEFLAARAKKEEAIVRQAADMVASLESDREILRQTKQDIVRAKAELVDIKEENTTRRSELESVEKSLSDLRKMLLDGGRPAKGA